MNITGINNVTYGVDDMDAAKRFWTDFGLALILTFVIIDILFPGSTGVMKNLGIIVGQFSKEGLAGLVALLMFLILFKNRQPG